MINDKLRVVHPCAAGLDVHKMQITATVLVCAAGQGAPHSETRTFSALPGGIAELVAWLQRHKVSAAVMEGTGIYWEAPWDALTGAGIEAQLMNAQHVKQMRGRKTDVEDSVWLANVCQLGLGRPSLVLSKSFRELRALNRHRQRLVRSCAQLRNRVHKVLDRTGLRLGGILSDVFGMNGRRILSGLLNGLPAPMILGSLSQHVARKLEPLADALEARLSAADLMILNDCLSQHDYLQQQICCVDERLDSALQPYSELIELLKTIPSISHHSARSVLIEIGPDISVFDTAAQFGAWCGVCPGNRESAGKRRNARARSSNTAIRTALVECANGAARTKHCQFQGYHKTLTVRRGYKRATVATAHKLARCIFAVLRDRQPYRDPMVDYERIVVQRNAARWLRQLEKFDLLQFQPDGSARVVFP